MSSSNHVMGRDGTVLGIADVRRAADLIKRSKLLVRTPLVCCVELSQQLGIELYLKLENMQRTGAFKIRGALVKLLALSDEQRTRGIIATSTGNHGRGIAFLGNHFGIPATVVLPATTPKVKETAIAAEGARVIRHGATYAEAEEYAYELAESEGLTYIHSFDDADVIAGQGTIALEILEDLPDADMLIVPVGGGALLAGSLLIARELRPSLKVIPVEAEGAPALTHSLAANQLKRLPNVNTLADGMAVCQPGQLCYELAREWLTEGITLVSDDDMAHAVWLLATRAKIVAEFAGAAALAALLSGKVKPSSHAKVVCVVSGGNIEPQLMATILARGKIVANETDERVVHH
ncbi:MAG TPA: threonine/serine dehydratase [Armatimonadetes bacterium]|nr:threonine/serine dehydratase [Armatimonadota bacterium]